MRCRLSIAASLCLSAVPAFGQSARFDLALESLAEAVREEGLVPGSITGLAATLNPTPPIPVMGEVKPGFHLISMGDGSEWSGGAIDVSYNGILLEPVSGRLCGAAPCEDLALEKRGSNTWKIQANGATWLLNVYPVPCQEGMVCTFRYPSWALRALSQQRDGGMPTVPKALAALTHSNGLVLLNAESGKPWLEFGTSARLSSLGALQEAQWLSAEVLKLAFGEGHLVLDLARDRWLLANGGGVLGGDAVAQWDVGPATQMISKAPGDLLHLGSEAVVWKNGMATLSLADEHPLGDFRPSPALFVAADAQLALSVDGDGTSLWSLSADGTWTSTSTMPSVPGALWQVAGSQVYSATDKGVSLGGGDRDRFTSLPGKVTLTSDGSAFALEESTSCHWKHLRPNAKDPRAFKESGLAGTCGQPISFSSSPFGEAVTTIAGGKLTTWIRFR